jgi:hypothetical protein
MTSNHKSAARGLESFKPIGRNLGVDTVPYNWEQFLKKMTLCLVSSVNIWMENQNFRYDYAFDESANNETEWFSWLPKIEDTEQSLTLSNKHLIVSSNLHEKVSNKRITFSTKPFSHLIRVAVHRLNRCSNQKIAEISYTYCYVFSMSETTRQQIET